MPPRHRANMRWASTSRFGALRTYNIYDDTLTVMCHNVSSYAFSIDAEQNVTCVDPCLKGKYWSASMMRNNPAGGPLLYVGQRVAHKGRDWTIRSVLYHYKDKTTAVFMFAL